MSSSSLVRATVWSQSSKWPGRGGGGIVPGRGEANDLIILMQSVDDIGTGRRAMRDHRRIVYTVQCQVPVFLDVSVHVAWRPGGGERETEWRANVYC